MSKTARAALGPILALGLWVPGLFGQPVASFPLTTYKLKNGLLVLLSEEASLPVVSVAVGYRAGSILEARGKTGIASILEKLMSRFGGSANVSPFQHIALISRVGGAWGSSPGEDRTVFSQTLPANQLALALWLESDRMMSLDITEEGFERARADLLDERREKRAFDPYVESGLAFDGLLYGDFRRGHALLGSEEDIRGLTVADARAFYAAAYAPGSAVLCVSGSFERTRAIELIDRYFASIPPGPGPIELPPEAPPAAAAGPVVERSVEAAAQAPGFYLGYRLGSPASAEAYVLSLLDYVLMRGRSARLPRRLLNIDNKIAYRLDGGLESRGDLLAYKVFATASQPMIAPCQAAVLSELDKLRTVLLSPEELLRAKNLLKHDYLLRTRNVSDRAALLVEGAFRTGKPETLAYELDEFMKVAGSEIYMVSRKYFDPERRILLSVATR